MEYQGISLGVQLLSFTIPESLAAGLNEHCLYKGEMQWLYIPNDKYTFVWTIENQLIHIFFNATGAQLKDDQVINIHPNL